MLCATFVNSKNIHLPNLMSSILQQLHLISNLTYSKDKRLGTHIDISTSSGFNLILLRRLSISDFPFQWHLFDQKVILLKILYQQGFKNVFTSQTSGLSVTVPKLGRKIFRTVGDGPEVETFQSLGRPEVLDVWTKMDILAIHKMAKWPFLSRCTKLWDRRQWF